MKKIQKRKEKMRRWNTKRQEISAKSCKTVSPLRHQSNYWVRRSPSQEHPRRYYTLRGSQPIRKTEIQKCLVYVKRQTETENYRICAQGASGLTASHTHTWKHWHLEVMPTPPTQTIRQLSLKKWNVPVQRNSVFWHLGTPDNEQQLSWSSFSRSLT